jgi:hypothetical protein
MSSVSVNNTTLRSGITSQLMEDNGSSGMEELKPSEPGQRDLTSLPTTTTKSSTTTMQCLDHIEEVTTLFK